MEIRNTEYRLKYGVQNYILDIFPAGLAAYLNIKLSGYGIRRMSEACGQLPKFCCSLMASAGVVFACVFLYEIVEQTVTGSGRKVRIDRCGDAFLVSCGCRFHYFRRSDIRGFHFDPDKKRLTVILTRCLEKRRGVYSYVRFFRGTETTASGSVSDYVAPLVAGGLDRIRFGKPDPAPECMVSPFAWIPLGRILTIEHEGMVEFSIPCPSGSAASGLISGFIGDRILGTIFESL